MRKKYFFRGFLLLFAAVSLVLAGCKEIDDSLNQVPDPATLGVPTFVNVIPGDRELTIEWQAVNGAAKYRMKFGVVNEQSSFIEVKGTSRTIVGLVNDTEYSVEIEAGNSIGYSGKYSTKRFGIPLDPAVVLLPPPNNLAAASVGDGSVTITWDAVPGAVSYKVIWFIEGEELDSDNSKIINNDGSQTTSATIDGLQNGFEYTIEVRAFDGVRYGYHAAVKATPAIPPAPPGIVDNILLADGAILGQVYVSWDRTDNAAGYAVYWSAANTPPNENPTEEKNKKETHAEHFVIEWTEAAEIFVWVAAFNNIGWGPWNDADEFTTRMAIPAAIPQNLKAVPSNKIVHLQWSTTENAVTYQVQVSAADTFDSDNTKVFTIEDDEVTGILSEGITIRDLINDILYYFRVRAGSEDAAISEGGWSVWSVTETATPQLWTTKPAAPAKVSFNPTVRYALDVNWEMPEGSDFFHVKIGKTKGDAELVVFPGADKNASDYEQIKYLWEGSPAYLTGLKDDTEYWIGIAAGNHIGFSDFAWAQGKTLTPVFGPPPVNLKVTMGNPGHMTVSWDEAAGAVAYEVEIKEGAKDFKTITIPNGDPRLVTTIDVGGFTTGTEYTFRVRSRVHEFGAWSSPVTQTAIIKPPVNFQLSGNDVVKQFKVTFDSPYTESTFDGESVNFRWRYGTEDDISAAGAEASITSPYTQKNLEHNTKYFVWAATRLGADDSTQYSEWIKAAITTKTPVLPSGVPILNAIVPGDKTLDVSWKAVSGAASYDVAYTVSSDTTWAKAVIISNITGESVTLKDLAALAAYNVRVRAVNADGETEWSTSQSGTTVLNPPAAPTGLAASNAIQRTLIVTWKQMSSAGVNVRYKVTYGTANIEANAVLVSDNLTNPNIIIEDLEHETQYWIWVSAKWAAEAGETAFGASSMVAAKTSAGDSVVTGNAPTGKVTVIAEVAYEIGGRDRDNELNYVTWNLAGTNNIESKPSAYGGPLGEWINELYTNAPAAASDWYRNRLSGVIAASWGQVDNAVFYKIYIATLPVTGSTAPPAPHFLDAVPYDPDTVITKTSHFIRDVTPDMWYYIWVRAANKNGEGPVGNPFVGRVQSSRNQIQPSGGSWAASTHYERGDYPKNLTADVIGEGTVHLKWNKADRATWYEVYYAAELSHLRHTTGGTSSGNNREMQQELWSEGSSSQGDRRMTPYRVYHATANPSNQAANNLNLHTQAIPWNDKEGKAGNPGEIHKIHALETVITGLDPGKRYWFIVRSPNHNGERGYGRIPYSGGASGTTNDTGSAMAVTMGGIVSPANVSVTPISPGGGGRLQVSWDPVPGAVGYNVYYSSNSSIPSFSMTNMSVSAGITSATIANLTPNTLYYVWVVSQTPAGTKTAFGSAAYGVPNNFDGTEPKMVSKMNKDGAGPVQNLLYIEVNDNDPRIALGYVLENTGHQFWDTVVIFAANLRTRNCATEGSPTHDCTKTGPHLHYNGNVSHIFNNAEKYIRPLQRAGIRVTMGLLGDHDALIYHSFGPWFAEAAYPWTTSGNPGVGFHSHWWKGDPAEYPLSNEAVINGFIEELVSEIERLGLDGFDMDDEWAVSGTNASTRGITTNVIQYSNSSAIRPQVTQNIMNLIYRARVRMDRDLPRDDDGNVIMPLAQRKIISMYNYGTFRNDMVANVQFGPGTIPAWPGTETYTTAASTNHPIWQFATHGQAAYYPEYNQTMFGANPPRAQYAPAASGFHSGMSMTQTSNITSGYAGSNPWQWKIWYGLSSGVIQTQVNHINKFSPLVYGQNVTYIGPDYPQDWPKR